MLYLTVPFEQKELAKQLGAKWDPKEKKWYVENQNDYVKFKEWVDGCIIVKDNFLIVEGQQSCWKCHKNTKVYAVGALSDNIIDLDRPTVSVQKDTGYDLQLWALNDEIPKKIREELSTKFGCKFKYSYTEKRNYFANVCSHCDSLQGNFFLYNEPDSPFGYMNDSELTLYKYELKEDVGSWLVLDRSISPDYFYLRRCKPANMT